MTAYVRCHDLLYVDMIAGIEILSAWDMRRVALKFFPGSRRNARKWLHAWRQRPGSVRVLISSAYVKPVQDLRVTRIPHGTKFRPMGT